MKGEKNPCSVQCSPVCGPPFVQWKTAIGLQNTANSITSSEILFKYLRISERKPT